MYNKTLERNTNPSDLVFLKSTDIPIIQKKIIGFVLLCFTFLWFTPSLYAKGVKWKNLKPVHLYASTAFHLREEVKCLVLKTCMTDDKDKRCVGKPFSTVSICSNPLKYFNLKLIKRFKKLSPKASRKANIRKNLPSHSLTDGFSIDSRGTIWRLNEVKDIIDILGEIDTPAEAQFLLWLNGKALAQRYRKVAKGYEVQIEKRVLSPCDAKKSYEEIFIYKRLIGKHGKVSNLKLVKHTKKELKHEYAEIKKPAIYLYPLKREKINVSLTINGEILRSTPAYKKGWSVMVDSNGTIEDTYDYLFYENTLKTITLPKEGWIKEGHALDRWFDVLLPKLGFNIKEAEQFKAYWLKELDRDKLYEIKCFSLPFLTQNMTLIIDPKPDILIRVIFHFKAIKEKYKIKNPTIITPKRVGFHVLEWGGMIENKSIKREK